MKPWDKYRPLSFPDAPADMTEMYNTRLSAKDEAAFQLWATANHRQQDLVDYDMRGAWQAGAKQAGNGHFPDTFKKPNHPTFSVESKYNGADGNTGGQWVENDGKTSFVPSAHNISTTGAQKLKDYFARTEPDVRLVLPNGEPQQKPTDKYANATTPWMRYQPRTDTLRAAQPTMAEHIPAAVKSGLRAVGLDKFQAQSFGYPIADALGYSPVGAAAQAYDSGQAAARNPTTIGKIHAKVTR